MRINSLATCQRLLGLLVLALFPTATLRGDRVELDTGAVVEGRVLRITTHDVSVSLRSGGAISFQKRNIRLIRVSGVATISADELALLDELPTSTEQYRRLLGKANARSPSAAPRAWHRAAGEDSPSQPSRPARSTDVVRAPPPQSNSPSRGVIAPKPPAPPPARSASPSVLSSDLVKSRASIHTASKSPASEVLQPRSTPNEGFDDTTPLAFDFEPPTGFVPWPAGEVFPVVKAYRHPVTEATLMVTSYVGERTLVELKERTAETYRNQPRKYRVARDEALSSTQHETLRLEVISHFAGLSVHQSQFFTGISQAHGSRALVITLSTPSTQAPQYRDPMLRSLRALRLRKATEQDILRLPQLSPQVKTPLPPSEKPDSQTTGKAPSSPEAPSFPDALPEFDSANSLEHSSAE